MKNERMGVGLVVALMAAGCKEREPCAATEYFHRPTGSCVVRCEFAGPMVPCESDGGILEGGVARDAASGDVMVAESGPDSTSVQPENVDPPRSVFPLSQSVLNRGRPVLRWEAAQSGDGAAIELCRDRAMTMGCVRGQSSSNEWQPTMSMARGGWFWRVRGVRGGIEGTRPSAAWWFWISEGSSMQRATVASSIADVNGDGLADLVVRSIRAIAADGGTSVSSSVDIFLGRRGGPSSSNDQRIEFDGGASRNVAVADLNGDGASEVLIGDPEFNSGAGRVLVFGGGVLPLGQLGSIAAPTPSTRKFGTFVDALGDLNGDGHPDLLVQTGGVSFSGATNALHLFRGDGVTVAPQPSLSLAGAVDEFFSNAAGCDVNGDGQHDLLIAPSVPVTSSSRRVELWLSPAAALPAMSSRTVTDPAPIAMSCLGDRDGDGRSEVAVRDLVMGSNGRAHVFSGAMNGLSPVPTAFVDGAQAGASAEFQLFVTPAGDATADGLADLLVTWIGPAPSLDPPSRLLPSTSTSLPDGVVLAGVSSSRALDSLVANPSRAVGDVDGDGNGDFCFVRHSDGALFSGERSANVRFGTATGVSSSRVWRAGDPDRSYVYCVGM